MATIHRVRARWTGFTGAPGYTNLYWNGGVLPDLSAIRTFLGSSWAYWPAGVSVQVENTGDSISDADGSLQGSWSNTAVASADSQGTGAYAGAAGAVVHWLTSGIVRGKRLRGRTFLVPLNMSAYDSSGTLNGTLVSSLQTAADALVTAATGNFVIWARPLINKTTGAIISNGTSSPVTSTRVPDLAVSLRSRRD